MKPIEQQYPDAAEYLARERANLARTLTVGKRIQYSSVGEDGVVAGLGHHGTIVDYSAGLACVLFDGEAEPEWMDGRRLHVD